MDNQPDFLNLLGLNVNLYNLELMLQHDKAMDNRMDRLERKIDYLIQLLEKTKGSEDK